MKYSLILEQNQTERGENALQWASTGYWQTFLHSAEENAGMAWLLKNTW